MILGCSSQNSASKIEYPIDISLCVPRFQPVATSDNPDYFTWSAMAIITNHTNDLVWLQKNIQMDILICDVDYYIKKSNKIYKGTYVLDNPWLTFVDLPPMCNDTCQVTFILEKEFIEMEDLYIKIHPGLSLPFLPFDTLITFHSAKFMKHIEYKPSYSFHIDPKKNEISKIDYNIDSMINIKKLQIVPVNFW